MTGFIIPPGGPPGFRGPTIDDPDLLNDVLQTFRIREALQPFALSPVASPVIILGRVSELDEQVQKVATPNQTATVLIGLFGNNSLTAKVPSHTSGGVFEDTSAAPGAGGVLADTLGMAAGEHFINVSVGHNDGAAARFELQHRNVANDATLATYPLMVLTAALLDLSVTTLVGERFRIVTIAAVAGVAVSYITTALAPAALAV